MALHGDISVNHQRVGTWSAQRITTRESGWHTYRWEAIRASDGKTATGELGHWYAEGAFVLAVKVLRAAHEALGRDAPEDLPWSDPRADILASIRKQTAEWDARGHTTVSERLARHLAPDQASAGEQLGGALIGDTHHDADIPHRQASIG